MSYLWKAYHIFLYPIICCFFLLWTMLLWTQCRVQSLEHCEVSQFLWVHSWLWGGSLFTWWGPSVLSSMAAVPLCLPASRRGVLTTEYSTQRCPSPQPPSSVPVSLQPVSVCQLFIFSKLKSPHSKGAYSEHLTAVLPCLIFISILQLLD